MEAEKEQKRGNVVQGALIILLIIASFLIGSLYTKVKYLERTATVAGTQPTAQGQPPAKYASFDDAMKALAKQVKLDDKKLFSCMTSGGKKSIVDAQLNEGTTLGVSGTPAFYINGRFLGGAFPYETFKEIIDKEIERKGSNEVKDYSDALQAAYQRGSFDPKPKAVSVGNASLRGSTNAPIVLVEYSDFQCPFCGEAFPTVKQLLKDYEGNITFAYKHFPLTSIHQRAQKAAEASECAKDQGKFWEFHDALFAAQKDWSSL